jgi:thiamine-monophosphate kinase
MDVSDGLAGDLAKMMRASGVSAIVELGQVPLSQAARKLVNARPTLLDRLVTGGDDYELLWTILPDGLDSFREQADSVGIPIAVIGQVVPGGELPVFRLGKSERRFNVGSYAHF